MAKYELYLDENDHYRDEEKRYLAGVFDTYEEAVRAAKKIVDEYLEYACAPGMTAEELLNSYRMFGEDPFIVGNVSGQYDEAAAAGHAVFAEGGSRFSAWEYAEIRCRELSGK